MISRETAPRLMSVLLAGTLGASALTGCGGSGEIESRDNSYVAPMGAAVRFAYDYAGNNGDASRHDWCLRGTAYDPYNRQGTSASVESLENDDIEVTPGNLDGKKLLLKKVDNRRPLQPANEQTAGILDDYDCDTGAY